MFFSKAPVTREVVASKVEEAFELQKSYKETKYRFDRICGLIQTICQEYRLLPLSLQNRDRLIVLDSIEKNILESCSVVSSDYQELVCSCVGTKLQSTPNSNCGFCKGCGLTKAGLKYFNYWYEE